MVTQAWVVVAALARRDRTETHILPQVFFGHTYLSGAVTVVAAVTVGQWETPQLR
ncbi:hypothetical protein ABAC402_02870 [Asticcacaulis sp. AC402]|nr:hypothetical protein ABAC402_02870 [Asticcacaulis sp. AC402]